MGKRLGFGFLASWFRRKVVEPLHQILRRGAEPKQLAFSAALGITLGLFPICDALKKVFTGQASWEVLQSILHALLGWLVAAPFILGGLYVLCLPCFKMLVSKFSSVPSSPKKPLSSISSPLSAISSPRKSLNSPTEVRLKVRDV